MSSGDDARQIERYAAEAEAGYDVEHLLARRGRRGRPALGAGPSTVESVRLDPELRGEVSARARRDRTTTSHVIREALRAYLRTG